MKAKSKRKGNFPPLRFPEFKAEWKRKKLGEVAEIVGGGTPDTNIDEYWDGNIQWFTPSEIKSNFVSKSIRTITELGLKKSSAKLLPIGAILLTTRATIGDVAIAEQECATNQGFQSLIVYKNVNNKFIANWIRINKNKFIKLAKGSTFAEISKKDIEKINIFITELPEQTKIASFLSLIDERISTQMKIIEEWEKLKKGMIDELFLQKLILKEFDNEWEEISIGAIGTVVTGGTPSKKESKFWGGDFAWVTAQDFTEKYIYNSVLKLTDKGKKKSRTIPRNSVLVTCIASIGLNGINKVECAINQQINAIICNPLNYYEFIYYAILANTERLKNLAGQTAVPIINKSVFEKFTISKPKSLKEQQKIASILSSFDKKLTIERQILTQYQNQKKYLLQNMFI